MSHYQAYPRYKDSGIEWIGEIPEGWEVKPFFSQVKELKRKNKGLVENNILSLSYGEIIKKPSSRNLGLAPESYETYQIVKANEIIFRFTDLQNDKRSLRSAQVKEQGIISSAYLAIEIKKINSSYFAHLMRSYDLCKVFYGMGGGVRQSLKFEDVRRLLLVIPPPPEQQQIAHFLDSECARIDALITKKTRFIALLKEKRQAVITHAVTKGLNPNVAMKDSGIEWIGEIPEEWELKRLRHLASYSNSNVDKKSYEGQLSVKLCNYVDVYYNEMITSELNFMVATASDEERKKFSLKENDVIITKDSEDASDIGIPTLVTQTMNDVICGYHLTLIRAFSTELSSFILRSIQSHFVKAHFFVESPGITRFGLNQDAIGNIPICTPPISEVVIITEYITEQTKRIDTLIEKSEYSITLLKERRNALITAAVTGKIDCRNLSAAHGENHA